MTAITKPISAVNPAPPTTTRWLRGVAGGVIAIFVLVGCTSPTVLEGTSVTVATSSALFSLNDRTSYGSSPANRGVLQATNSSFHRYDDSSELVEDASFGTYQLLSNDPLTVKYTIASGATWSDGVPVDAADLLLAWVANSGALNTKNVDDAGYRDAETGKYATPFADDVVYFDGATSEGLQYATAIPTIGDDGRSLTLIWDNYVVDWPLLLQVGLPAHIVASHALGISLHPDTGAEDGSVDPDRLVGAQKAKSALREAIRDHDVTSLSKVANFWNSGFDLEAMPDDESLLVSTGPYTITAFVPAESVTLTANRRYSGNHSPVFETVEVRFLADPLDQIEALANGTVDVIVPKSSSEVVSRLAGMPNVALYHVPGGTYEHLDLTFAHGKHATFQDVRVREAFLKTVPTQAIRERVVGEHVAEHSERSSLVYLPDTPGYSESVANNGSARFARPDIRGAIALLAEAGNPAPVVCVMFDPSNPKRVQEYQLIADSAALAGFVVTNCSGPDWRNLLGVPGVYDAAIFAWSSTNLSVAGLQSIFGEGGRGNLNGYSTHTVESLLAQLAVTPDQVKQQALRLELDETLYSDAYGLPLYQDQIVVADNRTLTGVRPATLASGILWNVWEWAPEVDPTMTSSPVK